MAITKILRSTTTTAITLPPEIWKKAGWKLNDKVEVVVSECYDGDKNYWNEIRIDRLEDIVKYDRDYSLRTEIK
tara:strand:- start:250 stop:471 length:222 start_codon:yes stop_codon:yes gene_type:complete